MQFSENKTFSLTYNNKVRFILIKRLLSDRINVLEYDITKPQLGGTFKTYLLSKCKNIKKANFVVPSEDFESFSDNGLSDDDCNNLVETKSGNMVSEQFNLLTDPATRLEKTYTFLYDKDGEVTKREVYVKKIDSFFVEGIENDQYKRFSTNKIFDFTEEKKVPQHVLEPNLTVKCQSLKTAVSEEKKSEMLDGEYTTWYNNGMIKEKRKYIKGKLMTETSWDENGNVIKKKTSLTTSDFYYNYEVGKKYRIVYWPINDVEQTQEKVVTVKAIESKFLRVTYDGQEHNVKKLLRNRCQYINVISENQPSLTHVVETSSVTNELKKKHLNEIEKSFLTINKEISIIENSIKKLKELNVNNESFDKALKLINHWTGM